ncbi:hypothetical protein SAMN04487965_0013 [Microbulbifer donghaiensis]|uniref:Uncharacterized protein n=1 Tax=Microbulbifer donghaiensis TaxID=494016 RepID=A0A1M4TYW9_9GAMM|nr:hypothetical protein [Microbulbifer donghaiensis]SHE49563.1 hypothetical protein SAMN04487965_0013 [Microbulbifer donghaiensis]
MNLFNLCGKFLRWYFRVSKYFWRQYPGTTLIVVCAAVVSRVANIAAFILPLKILLLATSKSVPSYLSNLVAVEDKAIWIVWLSVAAFCFYALAVLTDLMMDHFSLSGGSKIMLRANEINVVGNQKERVKGFYSDSCEIWAGGIFVGLIFLIISLLNIWLSLVYFALFLIEFLISAAAFKGRRGGLSSIKRFMLNNVGGYLRLLLSINFLFGFVVILLPFFLYGELHVLTAILSIVLSRQMLAAMSGMIAKSVKIFKIRDLTDPLVFRHIQVPVKGIKKTAPLAKLLNGPNLAGWIGNHVGGALAVDQPLFISWVDPIIPDVNSLLLSSNGKFANGAKYLRIQLFSPSWEYLYANEEFLFAHLSRDAIGAPAKLSSFEESELQCQLLDISDCVPVTLADWKNISRDVLLQQWSAKPPKALVSAYVSTHPLLHQRIASELVQRVEIACETAFQKELLVEFLKKLPMVRRVLKTFPLYIRNQDTHPSNAVSNMKGKFFLINWGRWSVQPIGVKLPNGIADQEIGNILSRARLARKDIPEWFGFQHVKFSQTALQLEEEIKSQRYNSALKLIESLLCNEVVLGVNEHA